MAQPSIECYFNTRKRSAVDDLKINHAKKVLLLEKDSSRTVSKRTETIIKNQLKETETIPSKIVEISDVSKNNARKFVRSSKTHRKIDDVKQKKLQEMLDNMNKAAERCKTPPLQQQQPPQPCTSKTADLEAIRKKLLNNPRLAELKSRMQRFNESTDRLKAAEERTQEITQQSPKLKEFKSIEIEVPLSPQKSPEKPYLSPRKDAAITVRRNLLNCLSPTKNAVALTPTSPSKQILDITSKPALKLPFKYRYLYEMFEGIDIVCQILFNRKETITFKKLKPGVEKMLKRNLTEKHLAQIKHIYPKAFEYTREKLRVFGTGTKREEWELVIKPQINSEIDKITEQIILERKRTVYNQLLAKTKDYHDEFLKSLTPPMIIEKDKITRWHPEFDIEQVPDIDQSDIPQQPDEEKLTGQQVLERAKQLFNCNTKMELALARLQQKQQQQQEIKQEISETTPKLPQQPESVLKGIPKALLEKVRQKQAAKALLSMTRSTDKDKEIKLYSRLPEIARLTRNLFVAEKKGVLLQDVVLEKLANCYPERLNNTEMEQHLRTIAKEVNGWIVFHNIRNSIYLKLAKDADLSLVVAKLESLAKQKNET